MTHSLTLITWFTCSSTTPPMESTRVRLRQKAANWSLMVMQSQSIARGTQPTLSGVMQVLLMLWSLLVSSLLLRRLLLTLRVVQRESSSLPQVQMPPCLSWVSTMRNMTTLSQL
uniref:(northern house mosquito) hypothetical protein n=1 Tax=Culex pipiens TaxID=7175 RepID=A0A8D8B5Q5_CULPI